MPVLDDALNEVAERGAQQRIDRFFAYLQENFLDVYPSGSAHQFIKNAIVAYIDNQILKPIPEAPQAAIDAEAVKVAESHIFEYLASQ